MIKHPQRRALIRRTVFPTGDAIGNVAFRSAAEDQAVVISRGFTPISDDVCDIPGHWPAGGQELIADALWIAIIGAVSARRLPWISLSRQIERCLMFVPGPAQRVKLRSQRIAIGAIQDSELQFCIIHHHVGRQG